MTSTLQRPLSSRERAAWRRATDEFIIDAIFGSTSKPLRDGDVVAVRRGPLPCRLLAAAEASRLSPRV